MESFKYSKDEIKNKSVEEVLKLIHENEIHENSLSELSKEKLQQFILKMYNKGILSKHLQLK